MTRIDKLIYDALAGRRSVALPEVGTLEVKRRGAKKISDTQIAPPQHVVVLTPGEAEGAASVVSLISATGEISHEDAAAQYGSWLEGARRENGAVAIEGVGEIGEGGIAVAEGLYAALNPTGEEPLTMEPERRGSPMWLWILIGILAALIIAGGIWCWKKGVFRGASKKPVVETVVTAAPQPETTSSAASSSASAAVEKVSTPGFHVIAGAFKIESNADNYMARLKREHPDLTVEKVVNTTNGYNMVSIFQAPVRREASRTMNLYWDIDPYLWIYEQK